MRHSPRLVRTAGVGGLSSGPLGRPAPREASVDSADGNAVDERPLGSRATLTANGEDAVIVLVPVLRRPDGPSTVTRLVAARVVDSVERRSGRSLPHVSQEVSKVEPALGYSQPLGDVARVAFAADQGGRPRNERRRACSAMCRRLAPVAAPTDQLTFDHSDPRPAPSTRTVALRKSVESEPAAAFDVVTCSCPSHLVAPFVGFRGPGRSKRRRATVELQGYSSERPGRNGI
jgi:hypothetical protein